MGYMRTVILGLVVAVVGLAQRSDTVFYSVVTNSSAASIFVNIPAASNIGQPYHLVYAKFGNAPAKTCSTPTPAGVFTSPILAIYGGVNTTDLDSITNYTRTITPNLGSPTDQFRLAASAAGSFPFLAVSLDNWDNVNCIVTLFYSGGLVGLDIKKYADYTQKDDTLRSVTFNFAAATDNLLVLHAANAKIVVYGLVIFNSAANSLILQDKRSDATKVPLMNLTTYCASCQLVLPNTNFPMFATGVGSDLILTTSAATAVSGTVLFRSE